MISPTTNHYICILPYKAASKGARTLKSELYSLCSSYEPMYWSRFGVYKKTLEDWQVSHSGHPNAGPYYRNLTYVNWGIGQKIDIGNPTAFMDNNCRILNNNIGQYSDKRKFFKELAAFDFIPKFFTIKAHALTWLIGNEKRRLCVREKVQASGGVGLSIFSYEDLALGAELPDAPLYVEYKPKKHEFRYHFFKGGDGFLQQKRLRHGTEVKNFEIRNHDNNWVFCRDSVDQIDAVWLLCHQLKHIAEVEWGLHFGAFDIIYNQAEDKAYALEINTAPGLEGQTAKDYAKYFLEDHFRNTCGFNL